MHTFTQVEIYKHCNVLLYRVTKPIVSHAFSLKMSNQNDWSTIDRRLAKIPLDGEGTSRPLLSRMRITSSQSQTVAVGVEVNPLPSAAAVSGFLVQSG